MNRCKETFQHSLSGQNFVNRMKFSECHKVLKNLFGNGINHVVRNLGGSDQGRLYVEGINRILAIRRGRIKLSDRDNGFCIIGFFP